MCSLWHILVGVAFSSSAVSSHWTWQHCSFVLSPAMACFVCKMFLFRWPMSSRLATHRMAALFPSSVSQVMRWLWISSIFCCSGGSANQHLCNGLQFPHLFLFARSWDEQIFCHLHVSGPLLGLNAMSDFAVCVIIWNRHFHGCCHAVPHNGMERCRWVDALDF